MVWSRGTLNEYSVQLNFTNNTYSSKLSPSAVVELQSPEDHQARLERRAASQNSTPITPITPHITIAFNFSDSIPGRTMQQFRKRSQNSVISALLRSFLARMVFSPKNSLEVGICRPLLISLRLESRRVESLADPCPFGQFMHTLPEPAYFLIEDGVFVPRQHLCLTRH